MAIFNKKQPAAKAEPYVVPTLAECDEVYGALVAKRAELHAIGAEARKARKAAEAELAADTSKEVRAGVAELLGDGPSAKSQKRHAVAEARQKEADAEAALIEIERRLRDAKTPAVRAAIARVRPEWDRRMAALCDALKVVDAAHNELQALRMDLEMEDIPAGHFGAWPYFLGDGKVAYFLRETGYAD